MNGSFPPVRVRRPRRLDALVLLVVVAPLACGDGTSPDGANAGYSGQLDAFFAPDTASPLETVDVRIHLPIRADNRAFEVVTVFNGAARGVDTVLVGGQRRELWGTLALPGGVPDGDVTLTVTIRGTTFRDTARLFVRDRRPPTVNGMIHQVDMPPIPVMHPPTFHLLAGGRLELVPRAEDNGSVRWLGYELGDPVGARDSMPVGGQSAQAVLPLRMPAAAAGARPTFTVFARDAGGNRTAVTLGQASVYRYLDRLAGTAALAAEVRDVAWDAARDRLYLSQPASSRIAVLALRTMTWLDPIATPTSPGGLDLTPGGDSLLVGLARSPFLGVVDLRAATPMVDTVRLLFTPASTGTEAAAEVVPWVDGVRVAADGRAVVSLAHFGGGLPGYAKLVTLDLATGAQAIAFDGSSDSVVVLARAGDRGSILAYGVASGTGMLRYLAASRSFVVPPAPLPYGTDVSRVSTDGGGRFYMFGRHLFDEALRPIRQIGIPAYVSDRTALSPDGGDVYAANLMACANASPPPCENGISPPGIYLRFGRADGELREYVRLPEPARRLVPLPDGQRLVAVGATTVMLLDLTDAGAREVLTPGAAAASPNAALEPVVRALATPAAATLRVRWSAPR